MKNIYILLIQLLFLSCNNSSRKNIEIVRQKSEDSIENANPNLAYDTLTYDNTFFPVDSLFSLKVLTPGNFHNDEAEKDDENRIWFGVFENNQTYYIAQTKIKVDKVKDAIVDNENEETGWDVTPFINDKCIMLIESTPLLADRKTTSISLPETIMPNDSFSFIYLGNRYSIFASGGKIKSVNSPDTIEVYNYKLYIKSTINGIIKTSLLSAEPNFNGNFIKIIFGGDIDGDNVLDLIIDNSRHYNELIPTLYLSKPADKNEILKPIGAHYITGC